MRYPVWIQCCKRLNYDFCISQGSVATVLRWGWWNYSCLRHVSSRCCVPKIIKIGRCFTELLKNNTGTVFFSRHGVYACVVYRRWNRVWRRREMRSRSWSRAFKHWPAPSSRSRFVGVLTPESLGTIYQLTVLEISALHSPSYQLTTNLFYQVFV